MKCLLNNQFCHICRHVCRRLAACGFADLPEETTAQIDSITEIDAILQHLQVLQHGLCTC